MEIFAEDKTKDKRNKKVYEVFKIVICIISVKWKLRGKNTISYAESK